MKRLHKYFLNVISICQTIILTNYKLSVQNTQILRLELQSWDRARFRSLKSLTNNKDGRRQSLSFQNILTKFCEFLTRGFLINLLHEHSPKEGPIGAN